MRLVWNGDDWVEREFWANKDEKRSDLPSPMIIRDTAGIVSPIDGKFVEGRYARREHMKTHDVREVAPDEFTPRYSNPKRKHLNRD